MLLSLLSAPYSLFFLIGATVTAGLAWRHGRRAGWTGGQCATVIAAVLIGGTIGSRWLPVEGRLPVYGDKTVVGALLGAGLVLLFVSRVLRLGARMFEAAVPAVPIGMAIGRVGCFIAGCCFGTPTALAWGVRYPRASLPFDALAGSGKLAATATETMPLHPVQLYEAIADIAIAAFVMRLRPRLRAHGSAPLAFAALYSVARIGFEFIRFEGTAAAGLKPIQWGLLVATLGLGGVLAWRERRAVVENVENVENIKNIENVLSRRANPPAGGFTPRHAAICAFVVIAVISLTWATPLEALLLIVAAALVVSVSVPRAIMAGARVVPLGAVILFQGSALAPVDSFPKTWFTVGAGGAAAQFKTGTESCDGTRTTQDNTSQVYGIDVGVRTQRSRNVGFGLGASAFAGSSNTGSASVSRAGTSSSGGGAPYPGNAGYHLDIRGGAIWTDLDSKWIGATLGVAGGYLAVSDIQRVLEERSMVLGGLRIGKLSTKFLELRGPSASPVLAPVDYAHIGMGFAVDTGGSIVRVGIGDAGPYIAGHIVNGTWEIDPSLALSGAGTVVRFGMRRRFSLGRP